MALVIYEHFLQFSNEVEYFWKKRWSFGKALFLWCRYYNLGFISGNAFVFLQPHPSFECVFFVLSLRLYAMYRSNRAAIALLGFVLLAEVVVMGVIFGIPKGFGGNSPAPGVFICADYDDPHMPFSVFYYTAILCTETTLFALSLSKAWSRRKTAAKGGVLKVLTKDSVYYFGFLFWVYLGNQIIWAYNIPALNELGTGFAFSLSTIFANRLMISLRAAYYSQLDLDVFSGVSSVGSVHFCSAADEASRTDASNTQLIVTVPWGVVDEEAIELRTFNERCGF
ncbi:hypothetical protein K488DRAFT_90674 [Vararia minispora EC-137]|uniref:Uncharacterized protein n=1 Tax=Vararia minispora EC-137 TaxID=1314806 RepID=A0ACB8Q7W4_9AGAM|nr:hypothetical protein K488DRAFT_90674 [Vararia minispora EC-137]